MNETIFSLINFLNQNVEHAGIYIQVLVMMGSMIAACLIGVSFSVFKSFHKPLTFLVLIAGFFLSFEGATYARKLKQNPKMYEVGQCFQMKTKKISNDEIVNKALTLSEKITYLQEGIRVSRKTKLGRVEALEKRLAELETQVTELNAMSKLPPVLNYVVLDKKESVIAYQLEENTLDVEFSIANSKYHVPCSESLTKVVQNYQETGKIVSQ